MLSVCLTVEFGVQTGSAGRSGAVLLPVRHPGGWSDLQALTGQVGNTAVWLCREISGQVGITALWLCRKLLVRLVLLLSSCVGSFW
jgi:hypothetical protein